MTTALSNADIADLEMTASRLRMAEDNDDPNKWDDPRPWPALPDGAIHGLSGDFVNTVAPHSESDTSALLLQFLTFFAAAVGSSPHMMVESTPHCPRINVLLVGATSGGRKGTSLDQVRRVFRMADADWLNGAEISGLASGEGLIARLQDDANGNAIDKRLVVTEPEFARTLTSANRDGSILSAIIRDCWDRGRLQSLTRKNPITVDGAHVCIAGHITCEELIAKLNRTEIANGCANRFLMVCTKRRQRLPHGGNLTDFDLQPVAKRLREALDLARSVGRMRRTDAANKVWEAIYNAIPEPSGLLGALTARASAQLLRLSIIFALLDQSADIDERHVRVAECVWRYCAESATYIFGSALGDEVADRILEDLRAVYPDGLDRVELRFKFSNHITAKRLNAAVSFLVGQNLVRTEKMETDGRPRDVSFAIPRAKSVLSSVSSTDLQHSALKALDSHV